MAEEAALPPGRPQPGGEDHDGRGEADPGRDVAGDGAEEGGAAEPLPVGIEALEEVLVALLNPRGFGRKKQTLKSGSVIYHAVDMEVDVFCLAETHQAPETKLKFLHLNGGFGWVGRPHPAGPTSSAAGRAEGGVGAEET